MAGTFPPTRTVLAVIGVILAAFTIMLAEPARSGDRVTVDEFIRQTDTRIPELLDRYDIPGASVALVFDGEIVWTEGYGVADSESGRPVDAGTVFEAGSIAKSLTAWGVMRLVESGDVALEAPVEQHLDRWALPESEHDTEDVTVRRLLSNSSGLPFVIHFPSIDGLLAGEPSAAHVTPEQPPGEGFIYSNPGWVILALMIEDVTGLSYPEYMRREVLEPLGMIDSGFGWHDEFQPVVATGHTSEGDPVPLDDHGPYGAGSLYTTADDLARFVAASMPGPNGAPAGNGVLSPESVDLMHTSQIDVSGIYHRVMSESYGLGHFVETLPNGETGITHGGESSGWLTAYYLAPETGDGLIFLTNSRRSWRMVSVLDDWAEWRGFPSTVMTRNYARLESGVRIAIGVFAIGAIVNLGLLVSGGYRGTRRLDPLSRKHWLRRLALALLALLLAGTWWLVANTVAGPFFPILAVYLGVALTAFALTLLVLAISPVTGVPRPARTDRGSETG